MSTDARMKDIGILTTAAHNLVEGEGPGESEALGEPAVAGDEEISLSSGVVNKIARRGAMSSVGRWVGGRAIAGPGACNGPSTVESFTLPRSLMTLNMTARPRAGDRENVRLTVMQLAANATREEDTPGCLRRTFIVPLLIWASSQGVNVIEQEIEGFL